jgi:hypothetical protein
VRNLWYEVNPNHYQDEPEDNTSHYCTEQVKVWAGGGKAIHPEIATEIASWWQTSVRHDPFCAFQSSGLVVAGFTDAIRSEIARTALPPAHAGDEDWRFNIMALLALYAYVTGAPQPKPLTLH